MNPAQPAFGPEENGEPGANPDGAASHSGTAQPAGPRPLGIKIVSVIVVAEALTLFGAAALYGYQLAIGAPVASFAGAVFTLILLLGLSAWLFATGLFLFRGYRWTRAAALVAQLFVLTIGVPTLTGGLVLPGLAMVLPAVAAIVFLFDKRVISFASRAGGSAPVL